MPAKYTTIEQVSNAFINKELDSKSYFLMLDKGGADVTLCFRYNENLSEDENERLQEDAAKLVDISYGEPLMQALKALKIPCEWC